MVKGFMGLVQKWIVREMKKGGMIMFEDKKEIFREVYFLASERHKNPELDKKLNSYLNSLDFETIKTIQTIAYLGRDSDFNKEDSIEQRYIGVREGLDKDGWKEKEVEIYLMTDVPKLNQYLKNGFGILDIKL